MAQLYPPHVVQYPSFYKRLYLAFVNLIESPLGAGILAVLIYSVTAAFSSTNFHVSDSAYFNFLANAFLHGDFFLQEIPPSTLDLVYFQDKYYLYWSPFPAMVLLPFIAVFGTEFSDVVFNLLVAGLNVGLIAMLLRIATKSGLLRLTKIQRGILVVFFAVGTVHYPLAPIGKVWMTSQLIGFTCVVLAYLAAFTINGGKAWFFVGLALSGAMLTRNHLVFTGVFPIIYLLYRDQLINWSRVIKNLFLAALPLAVGLIFLLYYNYARFGNPFDNGIPYHLMSDFFREDFERYGMFSLHYVPINIYFQYIYYSFPTRIESAIGSSLFLLSPLFFGAFSAYFNSRNKWHYLALALSIFITNIPILLLMGTGFYQYGPRYTLDFTVPLLLLTALGIERWKLSVCLVLIIISIIHYSVNMYRWVTI